MDITISNSSSVPLYEQIISQIKQLVLSDALKQDEVLPSIRNLAKEIKVSIITVKRAYEELEAEGFIQTIPGKGTYVSSVSLERLKEARMSQIEQEIEKIVLAAKSIGMSLEDLEERLKMIYEED